MECTSCKLDKPQSEFYKSKSTKTGYRYSCKECAKRLRLEWYYKNPNKASDAAAKYYQSHKSKIKAYAVDYARGRRAVDINFRVKHNLRRRIHHALKGSRKSAATQKLLGCSIDKFKTHLQGLFKEGMNFENYGKWHVDHIVACASFDLAKAEEQYKCFHYTNLQPLWASDNLRKSKKLLTPNP